MPAARRELRAGPDQVARLTGVPARTVTRILRRHHMPPPAACDPLTGQQIHAHLKSTRRYERPAPGDMIHIDVKKPGKIADGGGRRAHGRSKAVRKAERLNRTLATEWAYRQPCTSNDQRTRAPPRRACG